MNDVPEFLEKREKTAEALKEATGMYNYSYVCQEMANIHKMIMDRSYGSDAEHKMMLLSRQMLLLFQYIATHQGTP